MRGGGQIANTAAIGGSIGLELIKSIVDGGGGGDENGGATATAGATGCVEFQLSRSISIAASGQHMHIESLYFETDAPPPYFVAFSWPKRSQPSVTSAAIGVAGERVVKRPTIHFISDTNLCSNRELALAAGHYTTLSVRIYDARFEAIAIARLALIASIY